MKKSLLVLLLIQEGIHGENIQYMSNNIHAFLPELQKLHFIGSFEKVNETLDIFNIKESEVDTSNKNFDNVGDMEGINFNLGYTFTPKLYFNVNWNQKKLQYAGTTLNNQKIDTYLRYQIYQNKNFAFAIDGGYNRNIAKNTNINNLETINNTLKDFASDKEITISEINNQHLLVYREDTGGKKTVNLENTPYVALINTKDSTFYSRAILSLKQDKWIFDTYVGYAETDINIEMDSSILHENDSNLKTELENISFTQKRTDSMFFGGLGISYQLKDWYAEASYQYNYLLRINGLNQTNMNHILNVNIHYLINDNMGLFIGVKIMSNHFNGEIPYLYGEYTNNSFNHKYGFMRTGIVYNF